MLLLMVLPALAALPADTLTALRRGDCAAVRVQLADKTSPDAALARASCGDGAALNAAIGKDPVLDPYLRLSLATQIVETEPARVAELLQGVELPGEAGLNLRLIRARGLYGEGKSLDARGDLRKLLQTPVEAEALWWLARGAEARRDIPAAIEAYESLWANQVDTPFAANAAERLAAMGHPVPDLETGHGRELALQRARKLVKAARAAEAVPLYDALTAASGDTSPAWIHEVAMALFQAKDYPRAVKELARLDPTRPGVQGGVETLFNFALGTSRAGDYAQAATLYGRLVELYPTTKSADFASFKIAYLSYDAGALEEAIPLFKAHLERYPDSSHKDEALWFIGWSSYRLNRSADASAAFDRLLREHRNSPLAPGAAYWKARLLGAAGDAPGELKALTKLLADYPDSGHAWFAAERLGRKFTGIGEVIIPELPADFVATHPDVAVARALAGAGQWTWARERLLGAAGDARNAGPTAALPMAHALIAVGAYKDAQALARKYCGAPWQAGNDPVAMTACYPRPELAVVDSAARSAGLDPLLPYAIMTAESALDPSVSSMAGARGLMQLMPSLGEELNKLLQPGTPFDADRLFVPGYNAWLGTTELGRLKARFASSGVAPVHPLVIASYNGGADAVQRWLSGYESPPDADWFAETISFTETRQYVRRVLGYLMVYRWIYGDSA